MLFECFGGKQRADESLQFIFSLSLSNNKLAYPSCNDSFAKPRDPWWSDTGSAWLPCTERLPWWVCSDVGLLVDEYRAACEGSIHFDLLHVGHRDQHVVLQLLEHLPGTQTKLSLEKLTSCPFRLFHLEIISGYYGIMSAKYHWLK